MLWAVNKDGFETKLDYHLLLKALLTTGTICFMLIFLGAEKNSF
jgi:hypothetical protein